MEDGAHPCCAHVCAPDLVHGKMVDFITHTIDDGTLYVTVRFTDQTSFCVRYACDMVAVGAELSDWHRGDFHIIREYMKPILR